MKYPTLCPGDEFATRNSTALGEMILIRQKIGAADDAADYGHTGIITDAAGSTLEALWTVKSQNVWDAYRDERILIVRNINMTSEVYAAGLAKIKRHIGQWYPFHRLILHLLGVAKWIHWDRIVCSELTAKFEVGCAEFLGEDKTSGFMRNYYGVNPDDLVDRWKISRYYTTVFEGRA
jgi:hypothetical protein